MCTLVKNGVLTVPTGLNKILPDTFRGCGNLKTLIIPNGHVESIGSGAFSDCPNLSVVYLPQSVKKITQGAFSGDSALDTIYIGAPKGTAEWNRLANLATGAVSQHAKLVSKAW